MGTSIASVLPLAFFSIRGFVWGLACRAVPAGWKWCSLLRPMECEAVISLCHCPLAVGMGTPVCHQLGSALGDVWGFIEGGGLFNCRVLLLVCVLGFLFNTLLSEHCFSYQKNADAWNLRASS